MKDFEFEIEDDVLAFDRSARTTDIDGRLRVPDCRISAAIVSTYVGSEVPNARELGLDPSAMYRILRPASELAAAAASFERVPLMAFHVAVSAGDPNKQFVAGAVSNVRFKAPWLLADIAVWDQDSIESIKSGRTRSLSCGYRFRAVRRSGTLAGDPYEFVMEGIEGNHVALVADPRVSGCMVADSAPLIPMNIAFPNLQRFHTQ